MPLDLAYKKLTGYIPKQNVLMDEPMKNHTSFKIGGPADILVAPSNTEEILYTLEICHGLSIPIFVMGNGSNLLVRDKGIRGVVLKIAGNYSNLKIDNTFITAQSGVLLSVLSRESINNSLKGLEFASGIPGTLGGAVTMNAGAYGGEIKNVVVWAKVVDIMGNHYRLQQKDMNFGYRTSFIQENNLIVLEVKMGLSPGDKCESQELVKNLTAKRREKQPLTYPSAGSTFKRPVGYYAGKLIQDCGLKGLKVGNAQISELHAGFIINLGGATAQDVINLISKVQDIIKKKYNVEMIPEVRIIGEE